MNELRRARDDMIAAHGTEHNMSEFLWLVLDAFKSKIYSRLPEGYEYPVEYFNHELKRQWRENEIMWKMPL